MRHHVGGHQRLQHGPLGLSVDPVVAPRILHPAGCTLLRLYRGIQSRSTFLRQLLADNYLREYRNFLEPLRFHLRFTFLSPFLLWSTR